MGDWTEIYRPKTMDDIVGNEKAVIKLRRWASSWNDKTPNKRAVILSGKPGIGKTSCAIALANDFNWTTIELNTSDARNAAKIKSIATNGAINETFSDNGSFISSNKGGRKLIILDEADNLYERIKDTNKTSSDLSDKGGKKAIIDTIKITKQPIILIVNDYYSLIKGSGEILKDISVLIKFYNPYSSLVFNLLKKICLKEEISVDQKVLKTIADRSRGDIRSAINDLESVCVNKTQITMNSLNVLGYRNRQEDIFNALREIFKTKNIKSIKEKLSNLDLDPNLRLLWINENLPREYLDKNDLANAYDYLSKSDIFLSRTYKRQKYSLWAYACELMNGGVSASKTHSYPNDKYSFPIWLRKRKENKTELDIKSSIIKKLSSSIHNSNNKSSDYLFSYFIHIFRNNINFAIKMKNRFDFSESEIKFLLGKANKHRLKDIMRSSERIYEKAIPKENYKESKKEEEKKEILRQSSLNF